MRQGVAIASKRFLVDDLALMVKYGIRQGDKLVKDKVRMRRFLTYVLGVYIPTGTNIRDMIAKAKCKIGRQIDNPFQ